MHDDPLTPLLNPFFVGSEFHHAAKHCGDWLLVHERPVAPSFHLVTEGACELAWPDGERLHLAQGDLLFFPDDAQHRLVALRQSRSQTEHTLALGDPQPGVGLVCGHFLFRHASPPPWFALLPRAVHLRRSEQADDLSALITTLMREMTERRPGNEFLAGALASTLLVYVLRHCMTQGQLPAHRLWAFQDPPIQQALERLHADPCREWRLADLAAQVGLSRSSLSERFHRIVGMPVRRYQTQLRMGSPTAPWPVATACWEQLWRPAISRSPPSASPTSGSEGIRPRIATTCQPRRHEFRQVLPLHDADCCNRHRSVATKAQQPRKPKWRQCPA